MLSSLHLSNVFSFVTLNAVKSMYVVQNPGKYTVILNPMAQSYGNTVLVYCQLHHCNKCSTSVAIFLLVCTAYDATAAEKPCSTKPCAQSSMYQLPLAVEMCFKGQAVKCSWANCGGSNVDIPNHWPSWTPPKQVPQSYTTNKVFLSGTRCWPTQSNFCSLLLFLTGLMLR